MKTTAFVIMLAAFCPDQSKNGVLLQLIPDHLTQQVCKETVQDQRVLKDYVGFKDGIGCDIIPICLPLNYVRSQNGIN